MPSRSNLVLTYALLVAIWATTPLAIVWSVSDIHLMWALVLRFFLALPLAILILVILGTKLPFDSKSVQSYFAGSFSLIGSQFFTYVATAYLSSGMIALMFGLAPIMAGLIGRFAFQQHLHRFQWLGMFIAVCGLMVICFAGSRQHIHPIGIVLMLLSVFSYSMSIFWVKHINAPIEPMAQATGSILFSALASLFIVPFIWQYLPTQMPNMKSVMALIYAVLMASLLAMFCYFKLVRNIQATTLSLTNVLTPMLAMLLGAVLNHEAITAGMLVGATVLLLGLFTYFYRDIKASYKLNKKIKSLPLK